MISLTPSRGLLHFFDAKNYFVEQKAIFKLIRLHSKQKRAAANVYKSTFGFSYCTPASVIPGVKCFLQYSRILRAWLSSSPIFRISVA